MLQGEQEREFRSEARFRGRSKGSVVDVLALAPTPAGRHNEGEPADHHRHLDQLGTGSSTPPLLVLASPSSDAAPVASRSSSCSVPDQERRHRAHLMRLGTGSGAECGYSRPETGFRCVAANQRGSAAFSDAHTDPAAGRSKQCSMRSHLPAGRVPYRGRAEPGCEQAGKHRHRPAGLVHVEAPEG